MSQTATPNLNGRQTRKPAAPVETPETASLPPHPDKVLKWATRIFLGLGSLSGLAAAIGTGGTFGVLLALVAGGQATAAVLLSKE